MKIKLIRYLDDVYLKLLNIHCTNSADKVILIMNI